MLALTTLVSVPIWEELKNALPTTIATTLLQYGGGTRLDIATAVIDALAIVEALGEVVGVDPGKPGVGDFAKNVYEGASLEKLATQLTPPVRHKLEAIRAADSTDLSLAEVLAGHTHAVERLREGRFDTVILDYDGTIVATENRYSPPGQDVVDELVRLVQGGTVVGIATGRGGSLGEALRAVIPESHFDRIVVGYYNGGYVQPLSVDISKLPPARPALIDELVEWLKQSGDYPPNTRDSPLQISITVSEVQNVPRLESRIAAFPGFADGRIRVAKSKHSIDIGVATNTKLNVTRAIAEKIGKSEIQALCIGDSGHAEGNDFELLGGGHGISVDAVCHRSDGCWSLFGDGLRGPAAVIRILRAIDLSKDGTFQLAVDRLID